MICTKKYEQQIVLSRNVLKVETRDTSTVNVLGVAFETVDEGELATARQIPRQHASSQVSPPAPSTREYTYTYTAAGCACEDINPARDAAIAGATFGVSMMGVAKAMGFFGVMILKQHPVAAGVTLGIGALFHQLQHSMDSAETRRYMEFAIRDWGARPPPPPETSEAQPEGEAESSRQREGTRTSFRASL